MAENRPYKKFKSGLIEAAIWVNEKDNKTSIVEFKSVTLRKSWHDDKKNLWRDSSMTFLGEELTKAILVLQKAQEELLLKKEGEEHD